jgi:hypothetical protein
MASARLRLAGAADARATEMRRSGELEEALEEAPGM